MEEGIDLRPYVVVLIKHGKLIILATLVAALAAALFSFTTPPVYEASASVAIVKSRTEIVFSPEFRTLSEEEMGAGGIQAVNLEERRKALAGLVVNPAIASKVIEELGSYLSQEEQNPSRLLEMVDAEVGGGKGDLIEIVVSSRDPEKAARIANAWGQAYEEHVNALYGASPSVPAAVGQQLADARKEYEEREQALVAFMAENEIDELNMLIDAQISSRDAVFDEQVSQKLETLAYYYDKKSLLQRLLRDARMLREVVNMGRASSSTTNALAVLLLKAEAFASSGALPGAMQLQLGAITGLDQGAGAQAADLEALIAVLESEQTELETSIQDLSQELLRSEGYGFLDAEFPTTEPLSAAIEKLHNEVDALRAELEKEEAQQRELTRARDLAWATYSTLADKAVEVEIATDVGGTQVRFAAPAVPPLSPASPKKKQSIALAAVVGLMIGVGGAFGVEYLAPDFAASTEIRERIGRGDKRDQDADEEPLGGEDFSN